MSSDINSVNIIGRLTRDPELRTLPTGHKLCNVSIATNANTKKGETWEDVAHFFNVDIWGARGEALVRFASKGDRIAFSGRLSQEKWKDENGANRERIKIVASDFQFLTNKSESTKDPLVAETEEEVAYTDEEVDF